MFTRWIASGVAGRVRLGTMLFRIRVGFRIDGKRKEDDVHLRVRRGPAWVQTGAQGFVRRTKRAYAMTMLRPRVRTQTGEPKEDRPVQQDHAWTPPGFTALPATFYDRHTEDVALDLLGTVICHKVKGE